MLFSSPDPPSLVQHIRVLYPLAHVMVGPEEADQLLRNTYEQAAAVPPPDRPSDKREWLVRLLLDAQAPAPHSPETASPTGDDRTLSDDAFRRDIAEQVAQHNLPVAFASCTVRERLLLTVDALTESSDAALADVLDTTASDVPSLREHAYTTLRTSLRDVLTGPERRLVDTALPDGALRSHLHTFLTDRCQPPPSDLESEVTDIVAEGPKEKTDSTSAHTPTAAVRRGADALRQWMNTRQGIASVLLAAVLLVVGIGGASLFSTESSPSSVNVVTLAARHAATLDATHKTNSPDEAAAYIERTWNRQVGIPSLTKASLHGVGRFALSDSSTVPVLLYTDSDADHPIAAYIFSYALLDQTNDQVRLPSSLRAELVTPDSLFSPSVSDHNVVLWRQRDDIFVVAAPSTSSPALRSRINP